MTRRDAIKLIAATGAVVSAPGCTPDRSGRGRKVDGSAVSAADAVLAVTVLSNPWRTPDPFLFCVHHDDHYPVGNERLGPAASLEGRDLGMDFAGKDGWRMYHGRVVPGFPQHPHRGFETVTIVRRGLLDHSDSLGAAARYGGGDVQWLTAGRGIIHAEMFPLLDDAAPNPLELFQIWLNLPSVNKMVDPHFSMLWRHVIPRHAELDGEGRATEITVVAGRYGDVVPAAPPPKSWATDPTSDVAMWTIKMAPHARWTLPAGATGSNRTLYFFAGTDLRFAERTVVVGHQIDVRADATLVIDNGATEAELLMLQGRPIGEPVARQGPFVMNTRDEIRQAYSDYRTTRFGGWPWQSDDPVHPREQGRFARHADGHVEEPG